MLALLAEAQDPAAKVVETLNTEYAGSDSKLVTARSFPACVRRPK